MINKKERGFLANRGAVFWIVVSNVFVYILITILSMIYGEEIIAYFALKPSFILSGKYLWTLILHMFSHFYFFHLFVNMFALLSLGGLLEKIIGKKRFLWLYLISGLFAGVLSVLLAGFFGSGFGEKVFGSPEVFMLGASGAIFGIAGLFVVILPHIRFSIIFLPFFSFPAYVMVPAVLAIMWGISIVGGLPIGNVAHFGGFLSGLAYGFYLKYKYPKKVMIVQRYFR